MILMEQRFDAKSHACNPPSGINPECRGLVTLRITDLVSTDILRWLAYLSMK